MDSRSTTPQPITRRPTKKNQNQTNLIDPDINYQRYTKEKDAPLAAMENQEIVKVQLIQRIKDEIARLEKTRTDTNPFLLSSDLKIQILNRLLQLILAPESFTSDVRHKYFGEVGNTKLSPKTLSELLARLYKDETYCLLEGKIEKVKNEELIAQKRGAGKSTNKKFYKELKDVFGDFEISPPVIKTYTLHKDADKTKHLNPIHDQGKFFFEWDNGQQTFFYRVIDKTGQEVSNTIFKKDLEDQLGVDLYHHFREAANSSTPTPRLIPFLPDILKITSSQKKDDTYPPIERRTFTRIFYLGDSLTDKGQLYDSLLGGWSGLKGTSPQKSFTSGFVWADGVDNEMAIEVLRQVVAMHLNIPYRDFATCSDGERKRIAEGILDVLTDFKNNPDKYENRFSLTDDNKFTIKDDDGKAVVFSLTQAIGGLTAHNYFGKLSLNPKLTFTRLVLSTLDEQCNKLLEADKHATDDEKAKTVVHILAGANDLVTVNERPTFEEADRAVDAIFDVIEKLYKAGYRQFDLSNLPNIGMTPRFLLQSRLEQLNAKLCSQGVCHQIAAKSVLFQNKHPDCQLHIFNLNHFLEEGLSKPKEYGFSTEYELVKVEDSSNTNGKQKDKTNSLEIKKDNWEDLTTLAKGCGFYRIKENANVTDLYDKIEHAAYIIQGNKLYYINKDNNDKRFRSSFTLALSGNDVLKLDGEIHCADSVKSLPRNKWEKIKELVEKENTVSYKVDKNCYFSPQFLPHQNKIYCQIENEKIQYRVMDPYDRVRQGVVTQTQLEQQANGCALLRSPKPPVNDGKVDIDIPSGAAFVRYENELYYIYRTSTDDTKQEYSFVDLTPVRLEDLDEFDADFKPWFASRQLTEKEKGSMEKRSLNWELPLSDSVYNERLPIPAELNIKINNNLTNNYLPFIQAILAEEDYVVARGDLFTPAQNTKAFQRVLDESGPIEPGDVVPVSNKAFNDLLHPIADFGGQWTTRFYNAFLLKFNRFQPALEKFSGLIGKIEKIIKRKPDDEKNKDTHSFTTSTISTTVSKTKDKESQIEASVLVRSFATAYSQKYAAENKACNFFSLFSTRKEPDFLESMKKVTDNSGLLTLIFKKARIEPKMKSLLVDIGWIQKTRSRDNLTLTTWAEKVDELSTAYQNIFKGPVYANA